MRLDQAAQDQENGASFSHQFFWYYTNHKNTLLPKISLLISFYSGRSLNVFKFVFCMIRRSLSNVFLQKGVLKIYNKFTGKHLCRKKDFNKVALQLYWNHTSAWVFSCKFVAFFQNTF